MPRLFVTILAHIDVPQEKIHALVSGEETVEATVTLNIAGVEVMPMLGGVLLDKGEE